MSNSDNKKATCNQAAHIVNLFIFFYLFLLFLLTSTLKRGIIKPSKGGGQMDDTIEKVLRITYYIVGILASVTTIKKNRRTKHKPKH